MPNRVKSFPEIYKTRETLSFLVYESRVCQLKFLSVNIWSGQCKMIWHKTYLRTM